MRRRALALLAAAGAATAVAGVYLILGLGFALLAGGVAAVAAGLLIDDGTKPQAG